MEIRNYINIIWRRKSTILLTLIATLAVVVVGTKQMTPIYQASAVLRIAVSVTGATNYTDYMYADRLMNTYVNIATSRPVVEEVTKRLALSQTPAISAVIIPNTELIRITVEYTDPTTAAAAANSLADVLITNSNRLFIGGGKSLTDVLGAQMSQVQNDLANSQQAYATLLVQTPPAPESIALEGQLLQLKQSNYASLQQQYEQAKSREVIQASMITVSQTAVVPDTPSSPRVVINLALGFIVGLIGGLGLALLFENLDTILYDAEQIEDATRLPALVKIPEATKRQLSAFQDGSSPFAEGFRNLATYLQTSNHQSKKVLLLTSPEERQGKSIIAFRLGCSLAELGTKVVVVDCDSRRPRLHSLFHLPNQIGLNDVLKQMSSLQDALQTSPFKNVWVLTSGSRQSTHTFQMLGSVQMDKVLESLCQQFDYVLLDCPPLLAVADVAAITPKADGVILVVRQAHAQKWAVQEASSFLERQNGKFKGLIINQAKSPTHSSYYGGSEDSGSLNGWSKGILKGKTG